MKQKTKFTIVGVLSLAMLSTNAYSGTVSASKDTLEMTCSSCDQIPIPTPQCAAYDTVQTICGTESWYHDNSDDCKTFYTETLYCLYNAPQTFTYEEWAGAGYYCNGDNPTCHK